MRGRGTIGSGLMLALLWAAPAWCQQQQQAEPRVDVSGTWEITSETPRGMMTRKVTLKQEGTTLTGTVETPMGSTPISDGAVEGNRITFTVTASRRNRSFAMTYTGEVEGDTIRGTVRTPRGVDTEWTGQRLEQR